MKHLIFFVLMSLLVVPGCYSDKGNKEHESFSGSVSLSKKKYGQLNISGFAVLNDVVADSLRASGSVRADALKVGAIKFSGSLDLHNSKIVGDIKASGSLTMYETIVEGGGINLSGELYCEKSQIYESIYIKASESRWSNKQEEIQLIDTLVAGDITFESGRGIVRLKGTAKISGQVIGGIVIQD